MACMHYSDRNGLQDQKKPPKTYGHPPHIQLCPAPAADAHHIPSKHSSPKVLLCFKNSKHSGGKHPIKKRTKSRELIGGILHVGCDCERKNGLQDQCPRSECRGAPECMTVPPTCGPSEFSQNKHMVKIYEQSQKDREAFVKKMKAIEAEKEKQKEKQKQHGHHDNADYTCFPICPKHHDHHGSHHGHHGSHHDHRGSHHGHHGHHSHHGSHHSLHGSHHGHHGSHHDHHGSHYGHHGSHHDHHGSHHGHHGSHHDHHGHHSHHGSHHSLHGSHRCHCEHEHHGHHGHHDGHHEHHGHHDHHDGHHDHHGHHEHHGHHGHHDGHHEHHGHHDHHEGHHGHHDHHGHHEHYDCSSLHKMIRDGLQCPVCTKSLGGFHESKHHPPESIVLKFPIKCLCPEAC